MVVFRVMSITVTINKISKEGKEVSGVFHNIHSVRAPLSLIIAKFDPPSLLQLVAVNSFVAIFCL